MIQVQNAEFIPIFILYSDPHNAKNSLSLSQYSMSQLSNKCTAVDVFDKLTPYKEITRGSKMQVQYCPGERVNMLGDHIFDMKRKTNVSSAWTSRRKCAHIHSKKQFVRRLLTDMAFLMRLTLLNVRKKKYERSSWCLVDKGCSFHSIDLRR